MESLLEVLWMFIKMYLIGFWSCFIQIWQGHRLLHEKELGRHDGKVAIVTGGALGIGQETTKQLCTLGFHVIIGTRFQHEANKGISAVRSEYPKAKLDFITLDLSSFASVRQFVDKFKKMNLPLNLLVNNAGVMMPPYALTEDGFDLQLAVNHISHLLLIYLLKDKLTASGKSQEKARIVNVASSAHYPGYIVEGYFKKQKFQYYSSHFSYSQSKLAVVLCTKHLHGLISNAGCHVTVNCIHPGMVQSNLYQHINPFIMTLQKPFQYLGGFWTIEQGCSSSVYSASSPAMENVGGEFIFNCRSYESSKISYDTSLQKRTWDLSCEALGIKSDWKFI